ncbi:unnamed protein product [Candida verbasci]|uniref:3',5'-cyclic-nucleotide phosphodiesterase n=1 Tax=Candida verbasci TaxID=1227364 RepID=A0A9W4XBQ8_9ASCO|nr:unnamed protein product [Candida verbasci]
MFEITFLGTSGGPLESFTCSLIIKPEDITYETLSIDDQNNLDSLICIDGGSGIASLTSIIYQESKYKTSKCNLLDYYDDSEDIQYYYNTNNLKITTPFINLNQLQCINYTKKLFNKLNNFLITHPHLDHVNGVVINSAGYTTEKNYIPKLIYGSKYTTTSLQSNYFNGIVWPNMPSFNVVNLIELKFKKKYTIGNYTVIMFPLSHGELNIIEDYQRKTHTDKRSSSVTTIPQGINLKDFNNARKSSTASQSSSLNEDNMDINEVSKNHYLSSAYLIELNSSFLLIFGDFESDLISQLNYNLNIWKFISPLIINKQLKAIILECSNGLETNENELYGHLTPKHIIEELKILEKQCKLIDENIEKPLKGLNILINHVKEPILSNNDENFKDPRKQILQNLLKLNESEKLGVDFSIALGGTSIIV